MLRSQIPKSIYLPKVSSSHNLSLEVVDLQQLDSVGTVVPQGDNLIGGHHGDHLLLVLDLLGTTVASEYREPSSDRWRRRRRNFITLVASVATAKIVLLHDTVDSTRWRKEHFLRTFCDEASEIWRRGADT